MTAEKRSTQPDVHLPRLAAIREQKGMSQRKLAQAIEVDPSTISRIEGGGRAGARTLLDLAKALDVTVEELAGA